MDIDVTTIVVSPFMQNCRLVMDRKTGEALVIDPGDEAERIQAICEEKGARVTRIINTHAHLDHAGGVADLKERLGVPFALHRADLPILQALPDSGRMFGLGPRDVPEVDLDLSTVSTIPFAGEEIRVLETPGHTPGGVTFLFDSVGFFGDTLFQGSIGRTDLGGDAKVYAKTLKEVVLALPDDTVVHTGHGPSTTIGIERKMNPFLNGQIAVDGPFLY